MGNILTKVDIQAYAPELDLSAYTDATISGMLAQSQARAAAYANVTGFDFQAVTGEQDRAYISNDGELQISVRRRPIVSVTSISLVKGGFSTSLTLVDGTTQLYQLEYPNNKLVFPNSYFYLTGTYLAGGSSQLYTLRGAKVFYNASYTGGWQTPPDDLKYALSLYFRDAYQKQFNTQGLSSFTQGSYSESYAGNYSSRGKSPVLSEAQSVLMDGGYVRVEF